MEALHPERDTVLVQGEVSQFVYLGLKLLF